MAYLTAEDQRETHLATTDDQSRCGATALPLPGARPLLVSLDRQRVTCPDCKRLDVGGTEVDAAYRISYLGGGDALLVPIRVHDCAGNLHLLTVTEQQARELIAGIAAALESGQ